MPNNDENDEPNVEGIVGPTVDPPMEEEMSALSSITPNSPNMDIVPCDGPLDGLREGGSDGEFWREKYHQLLQVRETEAEGLLREYHQLADKREECMKELIQALQEKVEWLEKNPFVSSSEGNPASKDANEDEDDQLKGRGSCSQIIQTLNEEREGYIAMMEGKVAKQRSLLLLYQLLSSLVISPYQMGDGLSEAMSTHPPSTPVVMDQDQAEEGDREVVTCLALNHIHQRVSKFNLSLPSSLHNLSSLLSQPPLTSSSSSSDPNTSMRSEDGEEGEGEIEFTPIGNLHHLPEHMRSQIRFTLDQCPIFLQQLTQQLFSETPQQEDSEDEK